MKKISFNDKFGLTQAVLDGRKTMTRRIIKCPRTFKGEWVAGFNIHRSHSDKKIVGYPCMYDADGGEFDSGEIIPRYKIGEVVAIAQSYKDCTEGCIKETGLSVVTKPNLIKEAGYRNKMFVRAALMPHHIRITNLKVERLQDISDEDCLKEGIYKGQCGSADTHFMDVYYYKGDIQPYCTPRDAFAALTDKVSGKGTWESNPYVFVYEFELID